MTDITNSFGTLYHPVKAFVVYSTQGRDKDIYVEAYDMDETGRPVNAHPLTVRESTALAKALDSRDERKQGFLKPSGLIPPKVLYTDTSPNGFALWHTPAQRVKLLFTEGLDIPCGKVAIPSLVWKASKENLHIYAVRNNTGLHEETALHHAPFFNLYEDGRVCMGTVNINISADCSLEKFMQLWEDYFFNSYFSHLIQGHSPVKTNIVQLWQSLVNTRRKFPVKQLVTNGLMIKDLIA
ncbi:MAG: PRTRC system protein B [Chitinophagaceae bacterium]|nr:PRTRC system protein B [Chitinophagaceae bacterium]